MRRVEGEVEEEGTVFLPLDELAGFGAEEVGEIVGRVEALILAVLQPSQFGAFPKGVHAAGDADELVETSLVRRLEEEAAEVIAAVPAAVAAEVPFADIGGAIALFSENVGQRGLLHPELVFLRRIHVVEDTKAGREFPAHQPHARRNADRGDGIGAGEPSALGGEPVEMGGGDVFAAVCADVGIAHVVGEDNDEVGFLLRRIGRMQRGQRCEQDGGEKFQGVLHVRVIW